jgi:hypothetical protein
MFRRETEFTCVHSRASLVAINDEVRSSRGCMGGNCATRMFALVYDISSGAGFICKVYGA